MASLVNEGMGYAWNYTGYPTVVVSHRGAVDTPQVNFAVPDEENQEMPPYTVTNFDDSGGTYPAAKVIGGVDWSTQPKQMDLGFEWTLPLEWVKWFSTAGYSVLSVEFYVGIRAEWVEDTPVFEVDLAELFVVSWLSKSAYSATNGYYIFKAICAGTFKFLGVAPVLRVRSKAGVSGQIQGERIFISLELKGYYSGTLVNKAEFSGAPASPSLDSSFEFVFGD